MTSILQDFTSSTSLSDNFTQSSPAAGTFTWGNNVGLGSAEGISVSLGSDQIWTTQQGYTISESGEYSISAFFQSSANSGYGALGFSIQGQDSNAGNYGAPDGSHIGAFFHGGGGGFLNNGAITNSGAVSGTDSPISWSNGGVKSDGSWYNFIFTTKANGNNKYDLSLKIFNSAADGTVGSLVTAHSLTDDMADSTREGPAITNANVGGANTLHTFFSAQGSRMTSIDNFLIDLEGDSLILQPGAPTVDLNGSADAFDNAATFTEVAGADDGSSAVSFTVGASNLGDLDSPNLNNLKVSLPTAESTSGDELLLDATQIDITGTVAFGEVTYNSTVFSYAIADASGARTVTFTSLDGIGGVDTAAPIASYEALLDALKFNNTSDSPAANPTRTFSVTAADSDDNVSDTATFTVTAVNVGPQLNYDTTTFTEAVANDGSIDNSITITLQEDTFAGINGDSLGVVSNVPNGLVAALIRASDTTATLSLNGNATAHVDADNVTNLTVTFSDMDFANSAASGVGNSTTSNLIIDYIDASNVNNPVIKGKASASIDQNTSTNINGFIISDDDNPASLTVKIAAEHGTLVLNTTTGITGTTSGSTVQFSGSIADLNTALNSIAYQSDLNYVGQDDLIIQVSDDNGVNWYDYFVDEVGKFFNQTNEHYYEFVSAPGITWADAKTAAEAETLYGLNGYLTTVTSAAENTFIAPKLGGQGWMGASDETNEGVWLWKTGPEAGTQFWSGLSGGSAVGGEYNNWATNEPNDSRSNEDHAHFLANGEWNDFVFNNPNIQGYVVEYGGNGTGNDGFGTLQSVFLEITVNDVNDAPALNNLDGDTVSATVNQVAFLDTGTANSITDVDTTDFDTGTLEITTISGTTDGNFSLDGTNATAGGDSIIAANDVIAVGGTPIGTVHATNDGQGGNTLTITLNGSATQANVSQLIQNIGYASASEGGRNFNLALSESDGKTANATLSADIAIQSSGGTNTDNTSTSTVDGVSVKTSIDTNGGVTSSTTTVPIVESTRSEDTSTAHTTHADIPLATNNSDQTILQVSLPNGVGLTSQEILGVGSDTLRELLIAASDPKIEDAQVFDEILQKGIDTYVETVSDESQVTLRTITFVADDVVPEQPIIVTGALGTGEDNLENPLRQEALVIDARNLPSGTELQFDDIEFAIVMGSGRVVGGHGRNFVIGDDANQFVVLGEADDLLRGGGGDDIIGSQDGDDQLFGDAGDDYLFGGADNDTLDGGEGHDWLQGSRSDAGRWVFSLNEENEVLSTFTADEPVLSFDSFTTNWFSGNKPITNDSRVAFVYRDSGQLESIATLHQAVLHRLPNTEEMNAWSQQNLSVLQLGEFAYQAYVDLNGDVQTLSLEAQITQLLTDVWGANQVSNNWINQGIDYLNNGGNWGEVLSFIAHHDNLTEDLLDHDGDLQLTQDLQTSELGWSSDSGDDTLIGGGGDDNLVGGYGHNYLDGGVGHDAAIMVETADVHHILINNAGRISVQRKDLTAINDLVDVEEITFSDKTLDVNVSNLSVAVLKNVAALAHLIDQSTLTLANLNQVEDSAMTTTDVAGTLMLTDSYSQNWASLSNHNFVSKLSETVLGSALTDDDLSFWTDQLDQNTLGRDDLLVVAVGVADFQDTLFAGDGLLLL